MTKILENTTASDIFITEVGFNIPALDTYIIQVSEFLLWATTETLAEITPFINSGDIIVNDGINNLNAADGIEHLKYPDFATSQRFLSEPERSNSFVAKNTQKAIEEARPDIEDNGVSSLVDANIINFNGTNISITTDIVNRKVNVNIVDTASDALYSVSCIVPFPGCEPIFTSINFLLDNNLCYIKSEEC